MAHKSQKTAAEATVVTEIKLIADPNLKLPYPRFYSNHISIHSSPFDFTLRFCDALPLYEKPKNISRGILEIKVPIVAEIVLPIDVFPNLISAMQEHNKKHQEAINKFGEGEKKEQSI